jgi:hypothetical protein
MPIVQPCSEAVEETKLVKKNTIVELAPSSTSRCQEMSQHHPFPPPMKASCFLAPDRWVTQLSQCGKLSMSTDEHWKPAAEEEDFEHSPLHNPKHHRCPQRQPKYTNHRLSGEYKEDEVKDSGGTT